MIYVFDTDHISIVHDLTLLPFDEAATAIFDNLAAQRLRIGRMALRIAAIALSRDMIVVTRNARDFSQIPGLRIEDWTI